MSETCSGGSDASPVRHEGRNPAALRAADWLSLAAAPAFAMMALLASVLGDGPPDMLCPAAHASLLSGMVPMYLLMSAVHSAPWLRLICSRGSAAGRTRPFPRLRSSLSRDPENEKLAA